MAANNLEGRTLSGRYEIKKLLGQGGMAAVYQGYDPNLRRTVAIKVIHPHLSEDQEFIRRFEEEAAGVAQLRHPNIVQVFDFNHDGELYYMVMEFVLGETLQHRLQRLNESGQRLGVAQAVKFAADVCEAADYAHQRGLIHRDIKPANVMLDVNGKAILMDFGIAKMLSAHKHTATGAVLGTAKYMAPEQIQGLHIDGRADIYALGVMLYEMLSGKPPFEADSAMTLMMMHMNDPLPDVRQAQPGAPLELVAVLEKATAKDRNDRYASAAQMAAALLAVPAAAAGQPAVAPPVPPADATLIESAPAQVEGTFIEQPGPTAAVRPAPGGDSTTIEGPPPAARPRASAGAGAFPASPAEAAHPVQKQGGRTWLWLLIAVLAIAVIGGGGFIAYQQFFGGGEALPGGLPVAAAATPTATETRAPAPTDTAAPTPEATATGVPAVIVPTDTPAPTAAPTDTPEPTPRPTEPLPVIGGADKIAYLNGSDIWVANLDGSGLTQITSDGTTKKYLRWLPDGQRIVYISGKCLQTVSLAGETATITCFNNSEFLDAIEISRDGRQMVVSLDRQLYLLPFDLEALAQADTHGELAAMAACPDLAPYQRNFGHMARFSTDGSQLAALVLGVLSDGRRGDLVQVFAIDQCIPNPRVTVQFPEPHFTFPEYQDDSNLESIAWDGGSLFVFHGNTRNGGFGSLHIFNSQTFSPDLSVNPVRDVCCYRDPVWSPDGTHLVFAFQNIEAGPSSVTQLYYIPFGSIGTGASYEPLPLPEISDPREKPWPALRPAAGP